MAGVHQRPGLSCGSSPVSDAGSGQVEKRRSALASGGAAVVRASGLGQSTGICRVRGEPRQCGDRAHRLVAQSMAPTGERRPSMACLRPIPAPPRLSPPVCPWLRRCRLREVVKARSAEAGNTTPRRTSLQGDFVRAVHGCTAPACWSRTRNHAADEIPLQRRPPPEKLYSSRTAAHARLLIWPCRGGSMPPLNWVKNLFFGRMHGLPGAGGPAVKAARREERPPYPADRSSVWLDFPSV